MITVLTRRVIPFLGLAALMVGFMWQQRVPPAHGDMWFHLRLGREFLDGWSVHHPGHLGPFDSADWVPTQWLTQVAMAWGVAHGGVTTVVWATGVVVVVLIASVYLRCRQVAAPLPATLAVTLGILAASPGFSARPQMLSYLFLIGTQAAWHASARDGRPRYWLLAVAWVWPMSHGLWPVGLAISVGMLAGIALERRFAPAVLARLGLVVVGSFAASALTPIGLESYRSLLVVGTRTEFFAEWGAPSSPLPRAPSWPSCSWWSSSAASASAQCPGRTWSSSCWRSPGASTRCARPSSDATRQSSAASCSHPCWLPHSPALCRRETRWAAPNA